MRFGKRSEYLAGLPSGRAKWLSRMVKGMSMRAKHLLFAVLCMATAHLAFAEDVNVALARWGATASASSAFDGDYFAENAIDGNYTSSGSDKWNTRSGWNQAQPHWLVIDFSAPRKIHRVVIRHEGVVGGGALYNTSDYRLQAGDSPDGPWRDLVPPVSGNRKDVTEHEFAPVSVRYLRLMVTKGEPKANEYARIFEVEAYSRSEDLSSPLAGVIPDPSFRRESGGGYEVKAALDAVIPPAAARDGRLEARVGGRVIARFEAARLSAPAELWLPVPGKGKTAALDLVFVSGGGETPVNRMTYAAAEPGWFSGGVAHIVSSSHQDIAWMNSPEICIRDRDRKVITPALKRLKENPDLRFSVETTLQLMEYLELHPERKEEIRELTRQGRLEWGATYHQPYESMYPGESLIRQVYLGRKWLKKTLPGCDSRIAWNPDVPGRAMQMPQILARAGIRYLLMSRHEEGLYDWKSPDGSGVLAYSPGHYHESGMVFRAGIEHGEDGTTIIQKYKNLKDSAVSLSAKLDVRDDYYRSRGIAPQYGVIMSSDFTGPVEMDDLLAEWNRVKTDRESHFALPKLNYSTGEQFFDAVSAGNPRFDTITGERPNVWLYIHGPTHHKALDACREAGWVLPAAETFAAIEGVLAGSFRDYPAARLDEAWKKAIYPDHGWGGKNGHITDRVFREAFEAGRDAGRDMLRQSAESIAARVKTRGDARPIYVFNHLSWARSGPVEATLDLFGAETAGMEIVDAKGNPVPHQVVAGPGGGFAEDERMTVLFMARNVPPVGYAVYYAVSQENTGASAPAAGPLAPVLENEFYRIELSDTGVRRIFDKELGKEVLAAGAFGGGDVFTMRSVGNGAGEFADVQQPDMEGFARLSAGRTSWVCAERGPVRTTWETAGMVRNTPVRLRIRLLNGVKRIDFETDILGWDGEKNREFRMAFPLAIRKAQVAYAVPMGVVEVGKSEIAGAAGERYTSPCAGVHPREVMDWFSASSGDFGVTISSSVSVFDWVDPTGMVDGATLLQPVLLASRKSCHWEGNWYLQTGDHTFAFSLTSHRGDWRNGWKAGTGAAQPFTVLTGEPSRQGGTLPETFSFCGVDRENVFISAIKKCDDDDSVIIRCCEIEGRDARGAVTWFSGLAGAERTNIIEEEGTPLAVSGNRLPVTVGHHAIETFKIRPVMGK